MQVLHSTPVHQHLYPVDAVRTTVVQPAPTRHLALGNLLPAVTRTAIELAFSQYGSLEEVSCSCRMYQAALASAPRINSVRSYAKAVGVPAALPQSEQPGGSCSKGKE